MWLRKAGEVEGLSRHIFLDQAAQLAGQWGVSDLRVEAIRRMEAMTAEQLGLQVVEHRAELSQEERDRIEQWIEGIVEERDAVAALERLVRGQPPSGDVERNRVQVERHRQDFLHAEQTGAPLVPLGRCHATSRRFGGLGASGGPGRSGGGPGRSGGGP